MARSSRGERRTTRGSRRRRWVARAIAFAGLLYAGGFLAFALFLPSPRAGADVMADGIVALTGDGNRLGPAVQLLEMGHGNRLLITGVNRATSKAELKALLKGGAQFDCCTDLGFAAADTRGNAAEAAEWARERDYKSLIVVTAAYHMPRSLLEFRATLPGVTLIAFPVASDPPAGASWHVLQRLHGEYAKYLAAWARVHLAGNLRKDTA